VKNFGKTQEKLCSELKQYGFISKPRKGQEHDKFFSVTIVQLEVFLHLVTD